MPTLADLRPGERARVTAVSARGAQRRRLLDLGLVEGTEVEAVLRAASGQPMAYAFRGSLIALRDSDASLVSVVPAPAAERAAPATLPKGAQPAPADHAGRSDGRSDGAQSAKRAAEPLTVALAGNPNTGKSTVFNALTGLRQRTGNWPGKTVARRSGRATGPEGTALSVVDLPGTYSLLSYSVEERVSRDYLLLERPDAIVAVVDATALERNLGFVLQLFELSDRICVCLNLVDEAQRRGVVLDAQALGAELGVPVIPTVASRGEGLTELLETVEAIATGARRCAPRRAPLEPALERSLEQLSADIARVAPRISCPRWIALRLLEGDEDVIDALRQGRIPEQGDGRAPPSPAAMVEQPAG